MNLDSIFHIPYSIFLFVLGCAVGSFLNVLADRLPRDKSILGRSRCDFCRRKLEPIDLIPVASFLFLRGRCRRCGRKLSWFYPAVEVLTGLAFVVTWLYAPASTPLLKALYIVMVSILIAIFFADLKSQIIPDQLQIALFICALIILLGQLGVQPLIEVEPLKVLGQRVLAGAAVASAILALFLATRGRGMGFGDVKLAFTFGFFGGILKGLVALYIGFVTGAVAGIFLIFLGRKKLKSKIAFGPFMVLGFLSTVFWWDQIFTLLRDLYHF